MIELTQVNLDSVLTELTAIFNQYETALMNNDLETLDELFWTSALTVRFGTAENLYGIDAIRAFRKVRNVGTLKRVLKHTQITTYGEDFATTTTEFIRSDQMLGRQSQTWVKFSEGWRVVSAHISLNQDGTISAIPCD
jgi:hypothetical protein